MAEHDENTNIEKKVTQLPAGVERTREGKVFLPPTDIRDSEQGIILIADMPGVGPDAVEITVEDDVLTVRGRVEPEKHEGYAASYTEYEVGDYLRQFTLSDQIDRDAIEAQMTNGVLTLRLPRAQPTRKKIEVKTP